MVFVLDKRKKPLMPCSEKRARLLLSRGRAVVHRRAPFTIRLKDRRMEESQVQPVVVKYDPGATTTGVAIVREDQTEQGIIHHALHLAEITHRGKLITSRMQSRAALRRGRRSRKTRYRQPRFLNRTKPEGWLPPSLRSRVDNILSWTLRYMRIAPIIRADVERVKFDTQLMENPEVSGVEYQRGELAGYEIWEYLLEKWGRKCAYCHIENVPLEKEHIIPKSRGGSNRVSNLTVACHECNQKKDNQTAAEFGYPQIQAKAKMPLASVAAVNATRNAIVRDLEWLGLSVTTWTGGRTKYNRTRFGIKKAHALDALCVGDIEGVTGANLPTLTIKAKGRGHRQVVANDAYGFPRKSKSGERVKARSIKMVHGFMTGDLVKARMPKGKYVGEYVTRIGAARASGSFGVKANNQDFAVSHKNCTLLQRADGYEYAYIFT